MRAREEAEGALSIADARGLVAAARLSQVHGLCDTTLPFRVEKLLGSKKLAEMAKAAKSLGRPQSAKAVCSEVLKRLSSR